jgi:hypothetical protein
MFFMSINRTALLIGQAGRIILIAGFALSAVASARAFEGTAEQREACTPDAFRLCSAEIPDVGRVTACMAAKQSSLSPKCRAVFQSASQERAAPSRRARVHKAPATYAHNRQSHAPHHRAWARS